MNLKHVRSSMPQGGFIRRGLGRFALAAALVAVGAVGTSGTAYAHARGVGLGVAAGVNIADADQEGIDTDTSFAWGFFVDIPIISTFYITPAATLYELGSGEETVTVTDIDLNFKFLIPLGSLELGLGVIGGLTTGLGDYQVHFGGMAYLGLNLVSNLDIFVTAQYKRLATGDNVPDYNNIHVFGGPMFRF